MNTTKNEHNPDRLRPETVGEGWRLLTKGEVQEIGDEWWYGGEWCPVHQDNVGRHYEFTTTRRRITPPTDTTGSGREGETPETNAAWWAGLPHESWETVAARMDAKAKQLERRLNAALAQVEALRRPIAAILARWDRVTPEMKAKYGGIDADMQALRAAIDSTQQQEKP